MSVLGIDSNARAIECTRAGASLNGLENVAAVRFEDRKPNMARLDRLGGAGPHRLDEVLARMPAAGGTVAEPEDED